jgi:hypothetical protein
MSRVISVFCLFVVAIGFPFSLKSEATTVEAQFQGIWMPKDQSSCSAPLRIEVNKATVVLRNKNRTATYADIVMCYSCAGGAQYSGIEVQLYPEKETAPSPFIIRFNPDEKEGVMVIEIQDSKLKKSFPFEKLMFKKCRR